MSKINDDKGLNENTNLMLVKNVMATVAESHNLAKLYQVGLLEQSGYGRQDIAIILDSTPRYVSNCISKIRGEPKTRQRLAEIVADMPKWFRNSSVSRLPVLQAGLNEAAKLYLQEPQQLLDKPQAMKLMLRSAGVLADEHTPQVNVNINLANLQVAQESALEASYDIKKVEAITIGDEDAE
jgi:hypothetical protein